MHRSVRVLADAGNPSGVVGDRQAAAERNAQLRAEHPAYRDGGPGPLVTNQQLRFSGDRGIVRSPSPVDRARAAHRDSGGILANGDPSPDVDGGVGSGEGEATTDLEKAAALRDERERLELRAMRGFDDVRERIETSADVSHGKRMELLDRVGDARRRLEYSRADATSVGHAHAMAERAARQGL
jgi:hypothetical protein